MPVVARQSARVSGHRDMVIAGRVYDESDPVVRSHPWLFESTDDAADSQKPITNTADLGDRSMSARKRKKQTVEAATAAPGEQRDTGYVCPDCDFVGTSTRSVKAHRRQSH